MKDFLLAKRRATPTPPVNKPETDMATVVPTTSTTVDNVAAEIATNSGNYDLILKGIGPFVFERTLGSGKFSRVLYATHRTTGQPVAIKIIDKHAHDPRVMARLVREITLMERLDHPNVVKLYETYETSDSIFMVMEYVPGCNLDEYLHQQSTNTLSEDEARRVFRQLVSAVVYCHHRWVVHRDLKTPNILITPDGTVKLADFGLGNRFGLQRLRTMCGSMLYYSPEIISNQKYYGPEVDCWCLGVALFRMTVGFEPFAHAHTVGELRKDVCSGNYQMPSTLSTALQDTIRKCLQIDRRRRMTVRQALNDDPWLMQDYHGTCPMAAIPRNAYDDLIHVDQSNASNTHPQHSSDDVERQTRCQAVKDMHEPLDPVRRTVIYHPIHESTYFTTPEGKQSIESLRRRLLHSIRDRLHSLKVRSADCRVIAKVPFLRVDTLTTVMRRHKEQIHWFRLDYSPHSHEPSRLSSASQRPPSSALPTPPSSSSAQAERAETPSLSPSTSTSSTLSLPIAPASPDQGNHPETDLLGILKQICQLMGITYTQTSKTCLECILTLRDSPKTSKTTASHSRPTSPTPPSLRGKDGPAGRKISRTSSNQSASTSITRSTDDGRSSSRRLSLPLISHLTSSMTISLFGKAKQRHSMDEKKQSGQLTILTSSSPPSQKKNKTQSRKPQESATSILLSQKKDGVVLFSIHVEHKKDTPDGALLAVRFSKRQGSSTVFKMASGWVRGVLAVKS